jgi:hypothetical protein
MTIKEIYEQVNLMTPIDQRRFIKYYNDSITEVCNNNRYTLLPQIIQYNGFKEPYTPTDGITSKDHYNTHNGKMYTYSTAWIEKEIDNFEDIKHQYLTETVPFELATDLNSEKITLDNYDFAIIDNIIFLITSDTNYKSEFLRKSKEASNKIFRDKSKGKLRKRWN